MTLKVLALTMTLLAASRATAQDPSTSPEPKKPLLPATVPMKTPPPGRGMPQAPQPQGLAAKPGDPARVRATYEINGSRVNITDGDFFDCQERLRQFEPTNMGRPLTLERVYEQILSYAEAKGLGLDPTPDEIALFDPLASNEELKKQKREAWEKEGITQEMYDTYQRETRAIQKAKDLFMNNVRILSAEVFETYRRDHFTYRLDYLEFPASRFAEEIKAKPPTEKELEAFWKEDKQTQQLLRGTAKVSVEFVSFDPAAAQASTSPVPEVPRDQALAYYNKNKIRLDTLIPSEDRALMTPSATVPVSELKTPFQILFSRGIIAREILLSSKMQQAFAEAKKPGADLKALAAENGLSYDKLEKIDQDSMLARYPRFGPQIFSVLLNQNPGDLPADVKHEPQVQFFYRLIDKEGASLPDFAKVRDQLMKPFIETMSMRRAQAAAFDFRTSVDKAIDAETKDEQDKITRESAEAAAAEIKAANLTDVQKMEAIRMKHGAPAREKIRLKREALLAKYFDAEVKARGLTLLDTGPFDQMAVRAPMSADEGAARKRFVITNTMMKQMEPGALSQVMTDASSRTHFLVRLAEKTEPDYSKMSDGDLLAIKSQQERGQMFQPVQRWQYQDIMRRRSLEISPPK